MIKKINKMLDIIIPGQELFDESRSEFIDTPDQKLRLEHSLVSISKWESKWKKPFISSNYDKTSEEMMDYIRCMTLTQNINPNVYQYITVKNLSDVIDYIDDPMTATVIKNVGSKQKEIITSEIIYFWMLKFSIPFECQKWHINRLLTLVNVCAIKETPPKKMSQRDTLAQNQELNAIRRKRLHSKG